MPLSKLNLEVGCRTWRANPDDHSVNGVPKRGGYFEAPQRTGQQRPGSIRSGRHSAQPILPPPPPVIEQPIVDEKPPGPSEEELRIEREKRAIAEERAAIEEMNRVAQLRLEQIEEYTRRAAEERARNEELAARAAEEEAHQRLLHQQVIEEEKRRLIMEADHRLQLLREEVAAVEEKHKAELALWQEREQRAMALELEAEDRARARQAAEEARATERGRELDQERAAALERLKQDAIEEYRRAHDEIRRAQEEQLRKEVEEARQKISEESAARKAALEQEREATMVKLKEEARLEYQKHLDQHVQLGRETTEALKEATAKAAREFKMQSQEAIRSLYSAAGDHSLHPDPSESAKAEQAKPQPPPGSASAEAEIRKKRDALRHSLLQGLRMYTPADPRSHEWARSAPQPHRVLGISPASGWGTPAVRHRANSVGQMNLRTPFLPGSAMPAHLNPNQLVPFGNMTQAAHPRPSNSQNHGGWAAARTPAPSHAGWTAAPAPIVPPAQPSNSFGSGWGVPASAKPSRNQAPHQDDGFGQAATTKEFVSHQPTNEGWGPAKEPTNQATSGTTGFQDQTDFCVVTLESVPGFSLENIFGEVFGVVLREMPDLSRPKEMTMEEQDMMVNEAMFARRRAVNLMIRRAKSLGANCVIGLAFQTQPISTRITEITAMGTAVILTPQHQSAVMPNSVEHATRTAVEKPPNGQKAGGGGGEGKGQKKKNKGKGKQAAEENTWGDWNTGQDACGGDTDGAGQTQGGGKKNGGGEKKGQPAEKNGSGGKKAGKQGKNVKNSEQAGEQGGWGCGPGETQVNSGKAGEQAAGENEWGLSAWDGEQKAEKDVGNSQIRVDKSNGWGDSNEPVAAKQDDLWGGQDEWSGSKADNNNVGKQKRDGGASGPVKPKDSSGDMAPANPSSWGQPPGSRQQTSDQPPGWNGGASRPVSRGYPYSQPPPMYMRAPGERYGYPAWPAYGLPMYPPPHFHHHGPGYLAQHGYDAHHMSDGNWNRRPINEENGSHTDHQPGQLMGPGGWDRNAGSGGRRSKPNAGGDGGVGGGEGQSKTREASWDGNGNDDDQSTQNQRGGKNKNQNGPDGTHGKWKQQQQQQAVNKKGGDDSWGGNGNEWNRGGGEEESQSNQSGNQGRQKNQWGWDACVDMVGGGGGTDSERKKGRFDRLNEIEELSSAGQSTNQDESENSDDEEKSDGDDSYSANDDQLVTGNGVANTNAVTAAGW